MSIIVKPQGTHVQVESVEVPDAVGLAPFEAEARCQAAIKIAAALFPTSIGEALSNVLEDHLFVLANDVNLELQEFYPGEQLEALIGALLLNTAQIAEDLSSNNPDDRHDAGGELPGPAEG